MLFPQSYEGFVSVGLHSALCINIDGNFGVVCLEDQGIFCTTCKRPGCKHITHLLKVIEDATIKEMPPLISV